MDGLAAVPRKNGELVPRSRGKGAVFGMASRSTITASTAGRVQRQLIAQIAHAEGAGASRYYERWLASFQRLSR
jgi:hypothetical protein